MIIVEEVVRQRLGIALGYAAAFLETIDPTQRLTRDCSRSISYRLGCPFVPTLARANRGNIMTLTRRSIFVAAFAALFITSAPEAEARRRRRRTSRSSGRRSASSSGGTFRNCSEARAAGAAPVRRGQPGYSSRLDRDGDGVGCE